MSTPRETKTTGRVVLFRDRQSDPGDRQIPQTFAFTHSQVRLLLRPKQLLEGSSGEHQPPRGAVACSARFFRRTSQPKKGEKSVGKHNGSSVRLVRNCRR